MMVSRTMSLGTHEVGALKDTLHAQQELLQKLYNDLDQERESSAIAADETLSMILRLQGEKAAMEMEASQYKRLAEQKMSHAHETVDSFQELMYQKEMQIAALESQVQAYKIKLSSIGFQDLGPAGEVQNPENMLSKKNGFVVEEKILESLPKTFKRGVTLPPRPDSKYSEEIKKLDERVRGFTYLETVDSFPAATESKQPGFGVADTNRRIIKQFEDERCMSTVRESSLENEGENDEELSLLREIVGKVDALQSEISNWSSKKSSASSEDRPVGCFKEVLQCFLP